MSWKCKFGIHNWLVTRSAEKLWDSYELKINQREREAIQRYDLGDWTWVEKGNIKSIILDDKCWDGICRDCEKIHLEVDGAFLEWIWKTQQKRNKAEKDNCRDQNLVKRLEGYAAKKRMTY